MQISWVTDDKSAPSIVDVDNTLKSPPGKFPVTFAVAGDLGQTGWTKSTLDHIDECRYDPLASARPWMVTQGNHEKEKIPFFTDAFASSYNARWKMPFEESEMLQGSMLSCLVHILSAYMEHFN
ncbi:hypothetical protein V6N13_031646 [Hibiscus sabdariffa]|uniref:Acid phosphatase n=1 Tax=Hibiscus sabdariffa TaxID=183260 RepID=A0ABR2CLI4_9ROSI